MIHTKNIHVNTGEGQSNFSVHKQRQKYAKGLSVQEERSQCATMTNVALVTVISNLFSLILGTFLCPTETLQCLMFNFTESKWCLHG